MIVDNYETRKMIHDFFNLNYDLRLNKADITTVIDFINELPVEPHHCPVSGVTEQGFNL